MPKCLFLLPNLLRSSVLRGLNLCVLSRVHSLQSCSSPSPHNGGDDEDEPSVPLEIFKSGRWTGSWLK
ncbi:hypothetical protein K1719_006524 [Acacia pycnantha]|nr:hypothetical protein K1719_006524 [Acacia pycnantha]